MSQSEGLDVGHWGEIRTDQAVTDSIVLGDVIQIRNVDGNVTIALTRPHYRVEGFQPVRSGLTVDEARARPSQLLQARYEVVPFVGRTEMLREKLSGWLHESAVPVSARLVYGSGGQGKSRLAAQLARHYAEGWTIAQARQVAPSHGHARIEIPEGTVGLLVVVDYADRWVLPQLKTLLDDLQALAGRALRVPVLRVLLLGRAGGFWWDSLQQYMDAEFGIPADAIGLGPLGDEINRKELFIAARDRFAEVMDVTECDGIEAPAELGGPGSGQVLTIHMAALAAVDAQMNLRAAPIGHDRVSAYLLRRERGHWNEWNDRAENRIETSPEMMGRAVFVATLAGPLSYDDGMKALAQAQLASRTETVNQVLSDHRRFYPPENPDTMLEPLRPDRLGEDFLALTTPGWRTLQVLSDRENRNDWDDLVDPWAGTAISRLLTPAPAAEPRYAWIQSAVTTLVGTAARWPHIASKQLYPLLRAHPQLAIQAGGTALSSLAGLDSIDEELLGIIEAHLPEGQHVDLDTGIAALAQRLTDYRLTHVHDPAERAKLHRSLGVRLANAGLYLQAVPQIEQAVELYRRLAVGNQVAFEPDLATSLNNLGAYLRQLGQREEALTAAQEAAEIGRRLAAANPTAFESDLARSLGHLGTQMSDMGRLDEALAATGEAAEHYRRLAAAQPATYQPDLAAMLNNLGLDLLRVGQREKAQDAAEESVHIRRVLAAAHPDVFEPRLAASLVNLASVKWSLGRPDEALAASHEAVELSRRLAATNPAAYQPYLAGALDNLGGDLFMAGRADEALAATEEAVGLFRQLAATQTAAFEPELAKALSNLGRCQLSLAQPDKALAAITEAVELSRRLAAINPAAFEPDLAGYMSNRGGLLSELGQSTEALSVTQEAVERYRRLATTNPAAFEPGLANGLMVFGKACAEARSELPRALDALNESVMIYRRLAQQLPSAFTQGLHEASTTLAQVLEALGRSQEAAAIRVEITGSDPSKTA